MDWLAVWDGYVSRGHGWINMGLQRLFCTIDICVTQVNMTYLLYRLPYPLTLMWRYDLSGETTLEGGSRRGTNGKTRGGIKGGTGVWTSWVLCY